MYRSLKSGAAVACVAFHTTSVSAAAVNTTQGIYLDPTVTNNSLVSFPGFTVIGYGLNIFQLQPFDASTIEHAVQTNHRLIKLKDEIDQYNPGAGDNWRLPSNVACTKIYEEAVAKSAFYKDGIEAQAEVSSGGSAAGTYEVITGDASVEAGLQINFNKAYQYGLYTWKDKSTNCNLQSWDEDLDIEYISGRVLRLSRWDENDHDIVDEYLDFFDLHGTHVVTGLNLGSELSVSTWATNQDLQINANFSSDVKAKFAGIVGSGDAHMKADAQYKKFDAALGAATVCRGGDEKIASYLSNRPEAADVPDKLAKWVDSATNSPIMIGVGTKSLAVIISDFDDRNVASYGKDLRDAYTYVAGHPKVHRTKVRMVINSDWGEVELLTPSAFIEEDPAFAMQKPPGFQMSSTKVAWFGDVRRDETIDFIIRNNGHPVDLHLDHGRDGPDGASKGVIEVIVEGSETTPLVYGTTGERRFDQVKMNKVGVEGPEPPIQDMITVSKDGAVLTGSAAFGGNNSSGSTTIPDQAGSTGSSGHFVGGSTPGGGSNGQNYNNGRPSSNPHNTGGTISIYSIGDDSGAAPVASARKQRRKRSVNGSSGARWVVV